MKVELKQRCSVCGRPVEMGFLAGIAFTALLASTPEGKVAVITCSDACREIKRQREED